MLKIEINANSFKVYIHDILNWGLFSPFFLVVSLYVVNPDVVSDIEISLRLRGR